MRPVPAAAAIALTLFMFTGSANAQLVQCRGVAKPQQVVELLFGRKIGDQLGVTDDKWADFVDNEITPRFPDGLTVYDTQGQWRDTARNVIVHEPSKIVQIVLPGKDDDLDRLNAIAEAYKTRFQQQSVGVIMRPACVSF